MGSPGGIYSIAAGKRDVLILLLCEKSYLHHLTDKCKQENGKVSVITKQILDNCLLMQVDEDMVIFLSPSKILSVNFSCNPFSLIQLLRVAEQNEDGISDLKVLIISFR